MVGVVAAAGLLVIVGLHTLVAALAIRFLRVLMATRLGPPLAALVVVPLLLVASTMVVAGPLGLGPDLGTPGTVLFLLVAAPFGLGLAVDYLWMPAPEDVELPAARGG